MAQQNPNDSLQNQPAMTPPLHHQDNRQSSPHLPPRPPPPPTPSKKLKTPIPVPFTNSTDQLSKRVTRDLPNLSDCHGCRARINHTDPNDRLQTLDSFWRIVLLCKKCIRLVNSGQTCPYCFNNNPADSDCFKCCNCKRRVHKDCVCKYANSPPWSYCQQSGLLNCLDCWVPKFFSKSIGVCKKNVKLKIQNPGYVKSLQRVAKYANSEARKKVVLALEASNTALRKAVLAKNAIDLAKNALELVAKKDVNNKVLLRSSDDTNITEAVNDAELAKKLHRSMNSSPRISKTLCTTNTSYVDAPEFLESSGVSCTLLDSDRTPFNDKGEKLKVYSRTRFKEKVSRTSSEDSHCAKVYSRTRFKEKVGQTSSDAPHCVAEFSCATLKEQVGRTSPETPPCVMVYSRTRLKGKIDQPSSDTPPRVTLHENGSCVDSGRSEVEIVTYKRTRLKRKTCEERVGLSDLIREENSLGDNCIDLSGVEFSQQEGSQPNLHLPDASTLCPLSSDGDITVQGEICAKNTVQAESCIVQEDRSSLKYYKRKKYSKTGSDVHDDDFPLPTPDPSLPTSYSIESRTSSNVKHSSS